MVFCVSFCYVEHRMGGSKPSLSTPTLPSYDSLNSLELQSSIDLSSTLRFKQTSACFPISSDEETIDNPTSRWLLLVKALSIIHTFSSVFLGKRNKESLFFEVSFDWLKSIAFFKKQLWSAKSYQLFTAMTYINHAGNKCWKNPDGSHNCCNHKLKIVKNARTSYIVFSSDPTVPSVISVFSFKSSVLLSERLHCPELDDSESVDNGLATCKSVHELSDMIDDLWELQRF